MHILSLWGKLPPTSAVLFLQGTQLSFHKVCTHSRFSFETEMKKTLREIPPKQITFLLLSSDHISVLRNLVNTSDDKNAHGHSGCSNVITETVPSWASTNGHLTKGTLFPHWRWSCMCVCVHTEMRYMLVFMCVHIYVLMCTFICRWVCTSVCIHLHAYELSFVVYTSVCAYT